MGRLQRRPDRLDFYRFCDGQGIFRSRAQISDCAIHAGTTKQELNSAKGACLRVDLGDLCEPHRLRSTGARLETNRSHPITDNARMPTRGYVSSLIRPARPEIFLANHEFVLHPFLDKTTRSFRSFEVHGLLRLALQTGGPFPDLTRCHDVDDLQLPGVATAELAVDCLVEEHKVSIVLRKLQSTSDRPNLVWFQRAFLAHDAFLGPRGSKGANGR